MTGSGHVAPRKLGLLGIYASFCGVFALSGQLFMEFCGGTDEFDTSIDLRHVALIVAASVIAFLLRTSWRRMRAEATGVRDLRRQMSLTLRSLPFGGRGLRFGILTASITTLIQASAQASERGTTRFHDVIGWLIITLLVSALAAVVAHVIIRSLPDIALTIITIVFPRDSSLPATWRANHDSPRVVRQQYWRARLFSRPPPPLQT